MIFVLWMHQATRCRSLNKECLLAFYRNRERSVGLVTVPSTRKRFEFGRRRGPFLFGDKPRHLVTAGIHAEELGGRHTPDPAALRKIFGNAGLMPKAVTQRLVW